MFITTICKKKLYNVQIEIGNEIKKYNTYVIVQSLILRSICLKVGYFYTIQLFKLITLFPICPCATNITYTLGTLGPI